MTATLDIRAPADQTEGTRSQILRWLKTVGDTVTEHEPLIEIETDKVTVEVAAPGSGILREILKAEQEEIAPGDVLGRLERPGAATQAGSSANDDGPPEFQQLAVTQADREGRKTGVNQSAAPGAEPRANQSASQPAGKSANQRAVQPQPVTLPGAGAPTPGVSTSNTPGTLARLSPAVRRLLSERGLDPSTIKGTGEGGRLTIDDVLSHPPQKTTSPAQTTNLKAEPWKQAPAAEVPAQAIDPLAPARTVPHTAVRKRIASHMVQSLLHTAPHVTTVFEADLSAVTTHREQHRSDFAQRGAPLTFTTYFLAAIVDAIRAVPEANSRWTDAALEIYDDINIGVATAIEGTGLVVPVLRNVESMKLFDIASGLQRLVSAAREGRLEPTDVRGGTFTISNHGVSGSLLATPIIINQPQSAILGVGKLEKRPVVIQSGEMEQIVVRPKCYVTLTIDHRVMDGHQANRFLQTFVRTLEAWPAQ